MIKGSLSPLGATYVLEAPVEDLELLLGELGLLLQLVHALRAMAHGGQLKVIFNAVCGRWTETRVRLRATQHLYLSGLFRQPA